MGGSQPGASRLRRRQRGRTSLGGSRALALPFAIWRRPCGVASGQLEAACSMFLLRLLPSLLS